MTGMSGAQNQQYEQGNNNRVPNDPYSKVKFKIPSFQVIMMLRNTLIGK